MPVKVEMATTAPKSAPYRPPKEILDIFWTLSDGTDEQRTKGAVKLARLVKETKEEESASIVTYCRDRLVKGLSSGRKFARVGFAVALAQLLREQHIQTSDVLTAINEKLKSQHFEKSSKSEIGGMYLGRAFGFSSIVQAGCLSKMKGEALSAMTEELLFLSDKKSYLKSVCNKTLENIISQVSVDGFGEHIWPKLRDNMKLGWDSATLDILSLLLTCRDTFPDVVNKKFLKKHWGFPVLGEENDEKILKTTLEAAQREILFERIIPSALKDGRTVSSLWSNFGEKLMAVLPEKKADMMVQRQTLGLKVAHRLLIDASSHQVQSLILTAPVARCVFHNITRRDDPLAASADLLFELLCTHLKSPSEANGNSDNDNDDKAEASTTLGVAEHLWRLEAELDGQHQKGDPRVDVVGSANFLRLLDLMKTEEAEAYAETLMAMVKGKDKWEVLSENAGRKTRQIDACLRQLQHLVTSSAATLDLQSQCLALLLRLAYFKLDKKVKGLQHCEVCVSYAEGDATRKLCESLLYKSLNAVSTSNSGHQKKSERESHFIKLLMNLCQYVQELLSSGKVDSIKAWSDAMQKDWDKCYGIISQTKEPIGANADTPTSGFLLLLSYLGLQILADAKTASELLQDVYVCHEKATSGKRKKKEVENSEDTPWVEVLTEVLLHLMSLPSHLGRVVTATVFRMLSVHMTPQAIGLITEVLIPKKTRDDDAGGVMVEEGQEEDEDEDDDDEEDISGESDEESEGEDGDNEDDEEEDMEEEEDDDEEEEEEQVDVDEEFRESVKQALGQAADVNDGDEEEKELSDMSDSEMFKLDDMLAEVFRQRKKAGAGKKARQEKRAELANFRLRVLDLVENMIKGDRCGDFLLDLIKPLLLLSMRARTSESQALCARAQGLFTLLKSRGKMPSVKDTVHTVEEQKSFFQELLQLAQKTSDPAHMQIVSSASYIVMNVCCEDNNGDSGCLQLFQETLSNVINKKQSKPHFSFFTSIIEMNPLLFRLLSKELISNLKDENVKVYNKMLCCTILTSLCKKVDNSSRLNNSDTEALQQMKLWMSEAATVTSQMVCEQEKGAVKAMLMRETLQLVLALQARGDVLGQSPFDASVKAKLAELKSKFNTDLRKLANRVIAGINRSFKQDNGMQKKKKRKLSEGEPEQPQKKKLKSAA